MMCWQSAGIHPLPVEYDDDAKTALNVAFPLQDVKKKERKKLLRKPEHAEWQQRCCVVYAGSRRCRRCDGPLCVHTGLLAARAQLPCPRRYKYCSKWGCPLWNTKLDVLTCWLLRQAFSVGFLVLPQKTSWHFQLDDGFQQEGSLCVFLGCIDRFGFRLLSWFSWSAIRGWYCNAWFCCDSHTFRSKSSWATRCFLPGSQVSCATARIRPACETKVFRLCRKQNRQKKKSAIQ